MRKVAICLYGIGIAAAASSGWGWARAFAIWITALVLHAKQKTPFRQLVDHMGIEAGSSAYTKGEFVYLIRVEGEEEITIEQERDATRLVEMLFEKDKTWSSGPVL